ncbi:MAG: helix-turn-helix transcriptional regulator [Clostridiales bacterium]|nr:helix-turn-helix transcriptional regulator [Candidatus Cacconaster stercorequi]
MERDVCQCNVIHGDVVQRVQKQMPDELPIYDVSELFRVFGDSTRARMICALRIEEMCVCDLSALLHMTQSAISHQLRILRSARLVKARKQGREVYYSLDDAHIGEIFSIAFDHVTEERKGESNVLSLS